MMNVNKEKRLMKRRCSATSAMFGKMLHHNIPAAAATTSTRSSSDNKNINIESIINDNNNDDEVEPVVNVGTWIIGLMILEKEPSLESVRRTTQERLISKMIRYRSRLIVNNRSTYAHFEEVPEIDWDYHIPDLSSINEKPWTKEQLFEYLGKLNDFNYDMSKPLWRTLLIPKYENGQAAIIMCTNHAIGDGLALVEVLHRMLDESKPSDDNNASQPSVENSSRHKGKRTDAPKSDIVTKIGAFLYGLAYGFVAPILPADPPNKLRPKGYQSSGKKLVAQTKSIELSKINELRSKMQGVTINDVLMALMTLSLKSYYEEIGEFSPLKKITGQFPVSMRKNGESAFDLHGDPHNFISYAYYNFNFQGDRVDAIWNTKNEIDLIKLSPAPIVLQQHTQIGLALLPTNLLMKVLLHAGNMGTAQLSNVPGPQKQVTIFDGIKVNDMSFYLFSPLSMYFGILSYNGIVNAAINLDGSLGVNPNDIAKHWDREFDLLYQDVMEKASKAPNGMLVQPAHYAKENKAFALRVIAIAILLFSLLMMQLLRLLLISKDIPTEFKESI